MARSPSIILNRRDEKHQTTVPSLAWLCFYLKIKSPYFWTTTSRVYFSRQYSFNAGVRGLHRFWRYCQRKQEIFWEMSRQNFLHHRAACIQHLFKPLRSGAFYELSRAAFTHCVQGKVGIENPDELGVGVLQSVKQ